MSPHTSADVFQAREAASPPATSVRRPSSGRARAPSRSGRSVSSVTATAPPLRADLGPLEVRPLAPAAQLTRTLGHRFFVAAPDHYPRGYYPVPTALHADVGLGPAASWTTGPPAGRLEFYAEWTALDRALHAWLENPRSFGAAESSAWPSASPSGSAGRRAIPETAGEAGRRACPARLALRDGTLPVLRDDSPKGNGADVRLCMDGGVWS